MVGGSTLFTGFNPRTCDRCEDAAVKKGSSTVVSIHAPVIGANVMQHAMVVALCFNPRTCDRCEDLIIVQCNDDKVSIHAPVIGAKQANDHVKPQD